MKRFLFSGLHVIALLALTPTLALADDPINPERPGFTNGAATVGKHAFQLEEGMTRSEGENKFWDGGIIRYGLSTQIELRLGLPSWQKSMGFAPAIYGVKTTFAPNVALILQTSGERRTSSQAALEAELTLTSAWTLQVDAVRDSRWSSGFNLGRSLTKCLSMFIEGYRTDGWHGDGGLTYQLSADRQVDLSAGDHFVSVGYAWRLR